MHEESVHVGHAPPPECICQIHVSHLQTPSDLQATVHMVVLAMRSFLFHESRHV